MTHFVSRRERSRNEMTAVITPPPDRLNQARGRFSLSEVEGNSAEAIGLVVSGQIPSV